MQGDVSKAELMAPEDILIAGNSVIQPNNVNIGGRAKEGYKDGKALTSLFNFPLRCDIAIDSKQNIYVIDGGNIFNKRNRNVQCKWK